MELALELDPHMLCAAVLMVCWHMWHTMFSSPALWCHVYKRKYGGETGKVSVKNPGPSRRCYGGRPCALTSLPASI
jgi:hypothetical protein